MYRGKIRTVYMRNVSPTFFHCLVGWYLPKCLKGCSLGIRATKKRGLVLF